MTEEAIGKAKGGIARAKSLTAERRRQIATDAAQKRWAAPGTPANALPAPDGTTLIFL